MLTILPGLVNAHLHGPYGPQYRGLTRSRPFEAWMADVMARESRPPTPDELHACALVTGLENLSAGNTALVDQYFGTQTIEHVGALARGYDELGLRAWVFVTVSDLPFIAYTREAFPRYPKAIPTASLPDEMQAMSVSARYEDQLNAVAAIVSESNAGIRVPGTWASGLGSQRWMIQSRCSRECASAKSGASWARVASGTSASGLPCTLPSTTWHL